MLSLGLALQYATIVELTGVASRSVGAAIGLVFVALAFRVKVGVRRGVRHRVRGHVAERTGHNGPADRRRALFK